MIYPHVIRLREPWQRVAAEGAVSHRRAFNCPTGLDERERVWVVIRDVPAPGVVSLNGCHVGRLTGGGQLGEFDVTDHLASRNRLAIDVETDNPHATGKLLGEVQLEIRLANG